jgi:ABC-type uncharacterized transport system permease subunit
MPSGSIDSLALITLVAIPAGIGAYALSSTCNGSTGLDHAAVRYARILVLIPIAINIVLGTVGGAFITLAMLGTFTLDIIAGRGWVCIALVIFGRWRIFRGVLGALVFAAVFSLGLRLRITPGFEDVPPRTAAGAAIPGGHRRAGAVRPQRALSGRLPEGVSSVLRTRSEE